MRVERSVYRVHTSALARLPSFVAVASDTDCQNDIRSFEVASVASLARGLGLVKSSRHVDNKRKQRSRDARTLLRTPRPAVSMSVQSTLATTVSNSSDYQSVLESSVEVGAASQARMSVDAHFLDQADLLSSTGTPTFSDRSRSFSPEPSE